MNKDLPSQNKAPAVSHNMPLLEKLFSFISTNVYLIHRPEQDQVNPPSPRTMYARYLIKSIWLLIFPVRVVVRFTRRVFLFFGPWKIINELRTNLTSLGFVESAYNDLKSLARSKDARARRLASWNLAWWHANQLTRDDAKKCLHYLETYFQYETDPEKRGRALVLQLESAYIADTPFKKGALDALLGHLKEFGHDSNLYLALASVTTGSERMKYVNMALKPSKITPVKLESGAGLAYDRLTQDTQPASRDAAAGSDQPRVTVIIPAYNAAETIHTAIESMLAQTWQNLEVIVADDSSTDNTSEIAKNYAKKDSRIKIVKTSSNSGPYVARNEALKIATGEFITCNDSDDWSHPEKIERQATHLIKNGDVVANISELARAYDDLSFYRRGQPGIYIQANMSSLMFRRQPVLEKLGNWDSVRFGADSEFIKRLRLGFGNHAVVELKKSLYSFLRQSEGSLTGSKAFGYHGFMMGARKEYTEAQLHHHKEKSIHYQFPMKTRPFAVPYPMLPERVKSSSPRKISAIVVADVREHSPAVSETLELLSRLKETGEPVGISPVYTYMKNSNHMMDARVRELINSNENIQTVVYGESVACDELFVLSAVSLEEKQAYVPEIESDVCFVKNSGATTQRTLQQYFKVKKWQTLN